MHSQITPASAVQTQQPDCCETTVKYMTEIGLTVTGVAAGAIALAGYGIHQFALAGTGAGCLVLDCVLCCTVYYKRRVSEKEVGELRTQVANMTQDLNKFTSSVKELANLNPQIQQSVDQYIQTMKDFKNSNVQETAQIADLTKRLEAAQQKLAELTVLHEQFKDISQKIAQSVSQETLQNAKVKDQMDKLGGVVKAQTKAVGDLSIDLTLLDKQDQQLQNDKKELEKILTDLNSGMSMLNKLLDLISKEKVLIEQDVEKFEELDFASKTLSSVSSELTHMERGLSETVKNIQQLKSLKNLDPLLDLLKNQTVR